MSLDQWLLWAVVGLVAVEVVVALLAARAGTERGGRRPRREAGRDDGSGRVTCPHCDAENEARYRYCRRCVTELPGVGAAGDHPTAPFTRESM